MTTLLVGFDSAWTAHNSGALIGVFITNAGDFQELGDPQVANFIQATDTILKWQLAHQPDATVVLIDQPTIVNNADGQRPVENLVGAIVSRRYGGMQPANRTRIEMFGANAPIWKFLAQFGGPADPFEPLQDTRVFETYPVLTIIALGWTLTDLQRPAGRLPKYNPERRNTFIIEDWHHVCQMTSAAFHDYGLPRVVEWLGNAARVERPSKSDQDKLDACICLLTALYLIEQNECLMVGNLDTGYIVVPFGQILCDELTVRCEQTDRQPGEWIHQLPG